MELYSIFPLLLMAYFVVISAGCAELPQKTSKRCPVLFYGALTCTTIFFIVMVVNLFTTTKLPEASLFDGYIFWPCSILFLTLTLAGMIEISKRRAQKILSSIEFCLSELFLGCSILTFAGYMIYLLLVRGTVF